MNNQLHLAPIDSHPHKILDLGTGSGIWAIDMADKYPSASVIGADTAAVQPNMIPPNLQFEVEDVTLEWLWAKNSFDFIHARELTMAIPVSNLQSINVPNPALMDCEIFVFPK